MLSINTIVDDDLNVGKQEDRNLTQSRKQTRLSTRTSKSCEWPELSICERIMFWNELECMCNDRIWISGWRDDLALRALIALPEY